MIASYALVLTHNRQQMAAELVGNLMVDETQTFVIDHNSDPTFRSAAPSPSAFLVRRVTDYTGEDFNISALWNIGLDWIERHHAHSGNRNLEYAVTVLNDDVLLRPHFCGAMAAAIEVHNVDIASPGDQYIVMCHPPAPIALHLRPAGYAWTIRGSSGIRVDESMKVWYSDDDLWQQALEGKGYVLMPGWAPDHRDANGNFGRNPWWQEQAGRDRETFVRKWGRQPW